MKFSCIYRPKWSHFLIFMVFGFGSTHFPYLCSRNPPFLRTIRPIGLRGGVGQEDEGGDRIQAETTGSDCHALNAQNDSVGKLELSTPAISPAAVEQAPFSNRSRNRSLPQIISSMPRSRSASNGRERRTFPRVGGFVPAVDPSTQTDNATPSVDADAVSRLMPIALHGAAPPLFTG